MVQMMHMRKKKKKTICVICTVRRANDVGSPLLICSSLGAQGGFSPAAEALGRALQTRLLDPSERMVSPTSGLTRNLNGLARALASQPAEEGQEEFAGALAAVDHVNRVAWHCFVHGWPFDGETVMVDVRAFVRACAGACVRFQKKTVLSFLDWLFGPLI